MYIYPSFLRYFLDNGMNLGTKIDKIINNKQEKNFLFTHKSKYVSKTVSNIKGLFFYAANKASIFTATCTPTTHRIKIECKIIEIPSYIVFRCTIYLILSGLIIPVYRTRTHIDVIKQWAVIDTIRINSTYISRLEICIST